MRKSPSLLETLTNAAATSEQKRVCPGKKEDYMEVRKEDQRDPDEKVVEIEIERLRDFKNHPCVSNVVIVFIGYYLLYQSLILFIMW